MIFKSEIYLICLGLDYKHFPFSKTFIVLHFKFVGNAFFPALWRHNWHIRLCKCKVYIVMIWHTYKLHNDYHNKVSLWCILSWFFVWGMRQVILGSWEVWKQGVSRFMLPLEALGEDSSCLFQLFMAASNPWCPYLMATLCQYLPLSSSSPPLCVYLLRIFVIGFRAHLNNALSQNPWPNYICKDPFKKIRH